MLETGRYCNSPSGGQWFARAYGATERTGWTPLDFFGPHALGPPGTLFAGC